MVMTFSICLTPFIDSYTLMLNNAACGINGAYRKGHFMLIRYYINIRRLLRSLFFFFNVRAPPEFSPLPLPDAFPIWGGARRPRQRRGGGRASGPHLHWRSLRHPHREGRRRPPLLHPDHDVLRHRLHELWRTAEIGRAHV